MKKRFTEARIVGFLRRPIWRSRSRICRKHGFSDASYYLPLGVAKSAGWACPTPKRLEGSRDRKLSAQEIARGVTLGKRGDPCRRQAGGLLGVTASTVGGRDLEFPASEVGTSGGVPPRSQRPPLRSGVPAPGFAPRRRVMGFSVPTPIGRPRPSRPRQCVALARLASIATDDEGISAVQGSRPAR